MNKYIMKLYEEYMDATKISNEKMFFEWLNYKEIHIERYYEFLKWFGLDFDKPVIELDRGKYDTLSLVTLQDEKMIEISQYALDIKKDNVNTYNGKLEIENNSLYIKTLNSFVKADDPVTFIKQIPICDSIIYELPLMNKELFIGFYSSINDLDIQAKKEWLNHTKEELLKRRINYKLEEATTYDTYMCAVKTKLL